ncbi:hypothetical protein TIFTF001_053272, partial [Ficus carica]
MNYRGFAHHREADNHGSENGQRNVPAMAAMSVFAYRTWWRSMRRDPVLMHNSSLTGQMRVHEILNGHPRIIQGLLSMESGTFRAISNHVISRGLLSPTNNMTVDEHVIGHLFVERRVHQATRLNIGSTINSRARGCIGAIDCTHIPCVPPSENADAWINRKGFHSQNILAACSFDMKFTYMLIGYEGSCHDARMLGEAIAFKDFPIPPP